MKSNRSGVGSELKPPKVEVGDININTSGRSTHTNIARRAEAKKRKAAHAAFLKDNVMAPRGGRMGYLNRNTGKWTPKNWNADDSKRYTEKGGELNELKPQGFMRGLAGLGDIFGLGLTDFDHRGSQKLGGIGFDPISGGVDRQWGSERNLSKALQVKKASQARLDKLSNEGKAHRSFTSWNQKKGIHEVKGRGKRFDAEENARQESIQKRGGLWGQFTRMMTTDRGYTDNKGNWRDLNVEDKAATAIAAPEIIS